MIQRRRGGTERYRERGRVRERETEFFDCCPLFGVGVSAELQEFEQEAAVWISRRGTVGF